MIKPVCYVCGKELKEFGAILLTPPNEKDMVEKLHICRPCYDKPLKKIPSLFKRLYL